MRLIDVEVASWLAIALVSSIIGWIELRDARSDLSYLIDQQINGRRKTIARINVRSATARLSMSLSFLIIGIGSWLTIHAISPLLSLAFGIVFSVLLFVVSIWSLVVMLMNRRERSRLFHSLYEDHG